MSLGTDRLVRILKDMRAYLLTRGAEFFFDATVTDVMIHPSSVSSALRSVQGVTLADGRSMMADKVILSIGHSARLLYDRLHSRGVRLEAKPIAAGFRIEHPQSLINQIQLGSFGELCLQGNAAILLLSYLLLLATHLLIYTSAAARIDCAPGKGKVPVADYRLASEVHPESGEKRSCYSFCMCPGGQIVPTSVNEEELCINGMSFSKRQSPFANSALVVNVQPEDMLGPGEDRTQAATVHHTLMPCAVLLGEGAQQMHPLIGVSWQERIERKAALFGGGKLVVPVQRAPDFLTNTISTGDIHSSYRLGVKSAACHEIYPAFVTEAIKLALKDFDKRMPGFLSRGILHADRLRGVLRAHVMCL